MNRTRGRVGLGLLTLLVAGWSAVAAAPVEVQGVVEAVFAGPGGDPVAQLEWGVRNPTTDTTVSVNLQAYIVFSNGLRQLVFPPQEITLAPGDGRINLGFVILPDQAAAGPATFRAEARVQHVVPGPDGAGELVVDSDGFDVP